MFQHTNSAFLRGLCLRIDSHAALNACATSGQSRITRFSTLGSPIQQHHHGWRTGLLCGKGCRLENARRLISKSLDPSTTKASKRPNVGQPMSADVLGLASTGSNCLEPRNVILGGAAIPGRVGRSRKLPVVLVNEREVEG
jgi:hypothetical protein